MKNHTMQVIVAAAIALAVTGIARADSEKMKQYSEATLDVNGTHLLRLVRHDNRVALLTSHVTSS